MDDREIREKKALDIATFVGRYRKDLWAIRDEIQVDGIVYIDAEHASEVHFIPIDSLQQRLFDLVEHEDRDPLTKIIIVVDYGDSLYIGRASRALAPEILSRYGLKDIRDARRSNDS